MALFTSIGMALYPALVGLASTAAGALTVGAAGYGFSRLSKSMEGKDRTRSPTPAAPTIETAAATAKKEETARRKAMARSKSIFTTPLGLQEGSNLIQKKLLGT